MPKSPKPNPPATVVEFPAPVVALPPIFPPDPIPLILLGGSVNLFAGAPGVGKTAFLARFLRSLYLGHPVFGRQPNPIPKIVVISIDRSWHQSSQLWYRLAGWTDEELSHYCLQDDLEFDLTKLRQKGNRLPLLKHALSKLGNLPLGTLVVIDPIAPFLGGNLMDYDSCMVACTMLRRLCRERGFTLLGVAHSSKQKNDKKEQYRRLQDRIIGSAGQIGYTDTQMYLAAPEETGEPHYTFLWHAHHAPAETFPLGRESNGLFVPYGEGAAEQEAISILKELPQDSTDPRWETGVAFGDLIVSTGLAKVTIWRHLQAALKDGTVERIGHGKYRKAQTN